MFHFSGYDVLLGIYWWNRHLPLSDTSCSSTVMSEPGMTISGNWATNICHLSCIAASLSVACLISVAFLLSKWMYRYCSIVLNQSSDITAANIAQIVEWFKLGPARACQDQKTNKCSHFCLQRSMASSIQLTCLTVLSNNLFPGPLWSSPWSWTLNFILHAFLHSIIIIFSQHMPTPTQPDRDAIWGKIT